MPSAPGMTAFPNSAPDSFTPKSLNLVRVPEHPEGPGAEAVDVGEDAPGWHCE